MVNELGIFVEVVLNLPMSLCQNHQGEKTWIARCPQIQQRRILPNICQRKRWAIPIILLTFKYTSYCLHQYFQNVSKLLAFGAHALLHDYSLFLKGNWPQPLRMTGRVMGSSTRILEQMTKKRHLMCVWTNIIVKKAQRKSLSQRKKDVKSLNGKKVVFLEGRFRP